LVELAGINAWVYSNPLGRAEAGGDLHFLSICNLGILTRVALADVSGHGHGVSALADQLHGLMQKYIEAWDQSAFVRELNLAFHQGAANATYATVAVLGYYRSKGQLVFTNAGHLPPLWYHYGDGSWGWLEESRSSRRGQIAGLPVGLIRGTDYRQTVVTLAASDVLVLYTDGITEAQNGSGGELGRERLREWVRDLPVDSPAAIGEGLLDRLTRFRHGPPRDDETLIVLQRLED
jgi:sigma-B regulation protein RsbU (phosphoserine phosphatase)